MPADIINLRRARKAKARNADKKKADDHRLVFGRAKSEKQLTRAERERAAEVLDAHRRKPKDD